MESQNEVGIGRPSNSSINSSPDADESHVDVYGATLRGTIVREIRSSLKKLSNSRRGLIVVATVSLGIAIALIIALTSGKSAPSSGGQDAQTVNRSDDSPSAPTASPTAMPTDSPSASPTPMPTAPKCYTNLKQISTAQRNEVASGDPFLPQTFVICPDTFLTVDGDEGEYLLLQKPNVYVGCGSPSSIANNCTISGAAGAGVQIQTERPEGIGALTNVTIEDIVFTGVGFNQENDFGDNSVWAWSNGALVFNRCIWMNNIGGEYAVRIEDGEGDPENDPDISVTFNDCTFADNVWTSGVILNAKQTLVVNGCSFERNDMTQHLVGGNITDPNDPPPFSSVIDAFVGTLTVKNSCFKNNLVHLGSVTTESNEEMFEGNYGFNTTQHSPDYAPYNYINPNSPAFCRGIVKTVNNSTFFPRWWITEYHCHEFDTTSCALDS